MTYHLHIDKVAAYLRRYSSKDHPKTVSEIAETLSLDAETVGYVIHELLAKHKVRAQSTNSSEGYGYYMPE